MEFPYPAALQELMEHFKGLPGVGRRSAERMALTLFHWDDPRIAAMAECLRTLRERVGVCRVCGNLADCEPDGSKGLCPVCASPVRDRSCICVVEEAPQIRVIESSGEFRGVYHVLGGRIAPLEGKFAEDLTIPALEQRLETGAVREIILALSPDVEGQATAVYLSNLLRKYPVRLTRPARGLPAGSDLSYADAATVAIALSARVDMNETTSES